MVLRLLLFGGALRAADHRIAGSRRASVLAAGSLKEIMGEIGEHYKEATGATVTAEFGPSGLLRERIEKGEHVDLFASADMGSPSLATRSRDYVGYPAARSFASTDSASRTQ